MKRSPLRVLLTALACTGLLHASEAQAAYPERPVQIVVPFLAGGSVDLVARLMADRLAQRLGQRFVVENKAGAGGVVGADTVARANPDGYTLLLTAPGPLTTTAILMKSLPYDPAKAFAPVSLVCSQPYVLLTGPAHKGLSVSALINQAREQPDKVTYASQGIGTTAHLTGLLMGQAADVRLTHVSYNGFPPAVVDVMAGRVDTLWVDTANALPKIRDRSLFPIAVASQTRLSSLPDVPTFLEAGYGGIVSSSWFALVAPAGTPLAIRQRLSDEIASILKEPEVLARLDGYGVEAIAGGPDRLDAHVRKEFERWRAVIAAGGLLPK